MDSCIDRIIKKSKEMREDGTGLVKAELIIWHQDHAYEFLPNRYIGYRNLFINWCCKEDLHESDLLDGKESLFESFIVTFGKWCELVDRIGGLPLLDNMEASADETDKIFVTLIRQVHTVTRRAEEICWTVEETADNVLSHMENYYENIGFWSSMTVEEDMLDCLMFQIRNYCSRA